MHNYASILSLPIVRRTARELSRPWHRIIVLANRAPFRLERAADGGTRVVRSPGGLVTALEPLVAACSGLWVAHGPGNDDLCVGRDALNVPPANSPYRLRSVAIGDPEYRGYYYGFANEGLWPLCHAVDVKPVFRPGDFRMYARANERFASAASEEAAHGSSLVLVQDYHLALAPAIIRRRAPATAIVAFWHIPWPHPRALKTCPWAPELVAGLLASDIAGFQTAGDCARFIDSAASCLPVDIDRARGIVAFRGRTTRVRPYPVGVEWANQHARTAPAPAACRQAVQRDLGLPENVQLGVGIDRLDYTKGINEKFLAIECLLERHPEFRGRFVFVQVAEPSRDCLAAYQAARAQLAATSDRINRRFANGAYRPIVLLERHHEPSEVYRLYRAADLCYVGSLHDGMNLVAKEFVCAREDGRGVLVLSQFAGAARQLRAAVRINPYAADQTAAALAAALRMTDTEQSERMRLMRHVVERFDTEWWATKILRDALPLRRRPEGDAMAVVEGAQRWRIPAPVSTRMLATT